MNFVAFVLAGALVAYFAHAQVSARRLRARTLAEVRKLLQDVFTSETGSLRGRIGDRSIRVDLTSRGTGSSKEPWTEVGAASSNTTIQVSLRPQTLVEAGLTRMARGVDVIVGDETFDSAFIVDGAPADAVRDVLGDASLRERLVALKGAELTQTPGEICLAKKGWADPPVLGLMVACALDLATRLERPRLSTEASPYRGPAAGVDFATEIAALAEARARRKRLNVILFVAFALLVLAIPLIHWLTSSLRH